MSSQCCTDLGPCTTHRLPWSRPVAQLCGARSPLFRPYARTNRTMSKSCAPNPRRRRPPTAVDEVCIAAAIRGDEGAWSTIYHEFAASILSYLRLHRTPEPEDVLGEILLDAARSVHRFEGTAAGFRSWLFTIAHHRMVDHIRRAARHPAVDLGQVGPEAEALWEQTERLTVDDRALERMNIDAVRSLLQELAPDQRDVFLLVYVADMSLVEAARTLGKSIGSVKALHLRGLGTLRRMLAPLPTEP